MSENAPDIFSLTEIPVTLTYAGLGVSPITFFLRPFLHREEQEMRQAHFALADSEREKAQHAYNVALLCRLATRAPEGLPGYNSDGDVSDGLRVLLIESAPLKVKICSDVLTRYYRVTQPAEFFRDV